MSSGICKYLIFFLYWMWLKEFKGSQTFPVHTHHVGADETLGSVFLVIVAFLCIQVQDTILVLLLHGFAMVTESSRHGQKRLWCCLVTVGSFWISQIWIQQDSNSVSMEFMLLLSTQLLQQIMKQVRREKSATLRALTNFFEGNFEQTSSSVSVLSFTETTCTYQSW